jgi:3-hydroxyisobutyrate dehydrogenase-like beta-hydroxyacid dehydrogenase
MNKPVGIIGLGLMGQAFVKQLDSQNISVIGFDVSPERRAEFGKDRATFSAAEVIEKCEAIVLCLFDGKQIKEVLFGPDGVFKSPINHPLTLIFTSTCEPDDMIEIGEHCKKYGAAYIEMPISGTSKQVANGDCLGLVGGDEMVIAANEQLLDALCKKRMYIGDMGSASKAKLAINLVLGLHRAALAEGLVFGSRLGLDPEKLLVLLQNSAAASSVMKIKGPLMVAQKYDEPQSRVDQSLKDFGLIRQLAEKNQQPLPFASRYIELLEACLEQGEGQMDNAIIAEAIRRQQQ